MGLLEPHAPVPGSAPATARVPAPRVPAPRTAADDLLPRRERRSGPAPDWPAADRFADRTGLASTQARLLLAVFCGLSPDHAGDRTA
jgi:hypothetical protein